MIASIMSDTLLAWASKLPISAASFVGRLHITPIVIWWGEAISFALGSDYSFLSSSILTVFAYAQSALVYMAAFILCLVWSLYYLIYCLTYTLTRWGVAILYALGLDFFFVSSSIITVFAYAQSALIYMAAFILCLIWSLYSLFHCLIYMLYEWIYSNRRYTPTRAKSQSSYLRHLDAYVDPNHHGNRRSKPAKRFREVHEVGGIAGVDMASDRIGAAARSSSSPCNDVMCSCPDLPCTDVPAVHVIDDLSATIRSSTNLLCPLAFPRSTKTSCSHSRRKVKRLTLRDISLGSSSKLTQSSPLVACRSFPVTDSIAHVLFPWSSILVYDKGIAFS